MKHPSVLCSSILLLTACQQSDQKGATGQSDSIALPAGAPICGQYVEFIENYANKQEDSIKSTLLKRLEYDKSHWPTIDQKEADAYCKTSLERMQKAVG